MAKRKSKKDPATERRIGMEIVVDAYGAEEQAMGWFCYLQDRLEFPFTARCVAERAISPLRKGDEVEVCGMAPEEECSHEMFVCIHRERRSLGVPLSQLKPIARTGADTRQAVADWHYWVEQGYEFG